MGPPVRTVCVACLHSLEVSSGEGPSGEPTCPYCGHAVELDPHGSDTPTTGDGFAPPPDPEAITPKAVALASQVPGRIGRFVLREPLGEGGYGAVFRAYDPHLDREVALKVLKPNRLGEKALERFYREARAAARLDHPNIVGLHDAGRDEQRCWIAYQLVSGQTLSMHRDLEAPAIDESVRIVRDLALALDHAHSRGVFHRDLKPANVLIDESGRARLTDFGLARRFDVDSDLTVEGTILGTPQYMSPEAAAGRAHEADGRSDVYSLGVILYELICGKRPADVPSNAPLWRSTRLATPPTPRSVVREIPADLDQICMRALAFDPEARYPDARSFAEALDRYLEGRPITPFRWRPAQKAQRKGGLAFGVIVAASVLCIALGMSLQVGSRPSTADNGATAESRIAGDIPPRKAAKVAATPEKSSRENASQDDPIVILNANSKVFHHVDCPDALAIKNPRQIPVPNPETIQANRWRPCVHCRKKLEDALARAAQKP